MYERADVLSKEAELIGAVNTVVQEDGVLKGYNTDGRGYMRAVRGCRISGLRGEDNDSWSWRSRSFDCGTGGA